MNTGRSTAVWPNAGRASWKASTENRLARGFTSWSARMSSPIPLSRASRLSDSTRTSSGSRHDGEPAVTAARSTPARAAAAVMAASASITPRPYCAGCTPVRVHRCTRRGAPGTCG